MASHFLEILPPSSDILADLLPTGYQQASSRSQRVRYVPIAKLAMWLYSVWGLCQY